MCKDRKILFFDIDGTLITDDSRKLIPEDAKAAIRQAKENGHLLFINSGRVRGNIEDFIADGFDGIVSGCGTYITYGNEVLLHHELNRERCVEIALKCRECGMAAVFEHAEKTCYDPMVSHEGMEYLDNLIAYFSSMGRMLVSDITSSEFYFDKFTVWYNDKSDVQTLKEFIKDEFDYIQREGNFIEVVPKGFSKATGIAFLLDYFNIPIHNAYVFGDSNNDIEMMSYVENSVAMGNACDSVKEIAAFVTTDIDDSGIKNAMIHYGLI